MLMRFAESEITRTLDALAKEKGDLIMRVRTLAFLTDTSGTTDVLGGRARTSNDFIPELDFTYFFTKNIAAELILGITKHTVEVLGSTSGDLDLGTVRIIPPVLTLQYHFLPDGDFSPYLGAGINYVIMIDERKGRSVTSLDLSNEFGYAFQAGIDYRLNDKWSLNLDIKKIFVKTDIHVNFATIKANNTELNPLIIGLGVGYKF